MSLKLDYLEKSLLSKLKEIENLVRNTIPSEEMVETTKENKDKANNTNVNHELASHSSWDHLNPLKLTKNDEYVIFTKRTIPFDKSTDTSTNEINSYHTRFRRQEELSKYNGTIQISNQRKIFYYYWDLRNITDILHMNNTYLQSPYFFAFGKYHHKYFWLKPLLPFSHKNYKEVM